VALSCECSDLDSARTEYDGDSSDHALVAGVAASDSLAFQILMRRHVPTMAALARRITLNGWEAD